MISAVRYIIAFIVLLSGTSLSAQSLFPYDSASHEVVYSETFRLSTQITSEEVYASSVSWFDDSAKFTNHNADPPTDTVKAKKNKNKKDAEEQWANTRPLQMQDPAGGKVMGMGIIRYYAVTGSSIKLLYLKYDISIGIKADMATITISNIHYFHYNPVSYRQVPLYSFSGGKPCEEVGTIEALMACENFHTEFKTLALYCNKEIYGHIADYRKLLSQKKYLYEAAPSNPTTAKISAKSTTKPVAKKK